MQNKQGRSPLFRGLSAAVLVVFLLWSSPAYAANRFWVGRRSLSDRWEDPANWSDISKGTGGSTVPGSSDVAIFSYSGSTSQIRSAVTVQGIVLHSVWTGSLVMGTGTLTVTPTGINIQSGSFLAAYGAITISGGGFTQTGGIVRGVKGNFSVANNFLLRSIGGTSPEFTSTGVVIFNGSADQTLTLAGGRVNFTLSGMTINNTGGGTDDDVTVSGALLKLSGALTITLGNLDLDSKTVPLIVEGGVSVANAAQATFNSDANVTISGSVLVGAAGVFNMSGSTTVTLNGIDQNFDTNQNPIYNLTIGASSGVTLTSNQAVTNILLVKTGSVLALGTFTLYATGAAIQNYASMREDTGKIVHSGSALLITDSTFLTEVTSVTAGDTIYFTLTDTDENISGTSLDTLTITGSLANTDTESLTLTETSFTSGIFTGSIPSSKGPNSDNNGQLQANSTTTLSGLYSDTQDFLINRISTAFNVTASSSSSTAAVSGGGGGGGGRRAANVQDAIEASDAADAAFDAALQGTGGDLPSERGYLKVMVDGQVLVMKDVPVNAWFARFVFDIINMGIASGYRDARGRPTGEYGPANNVLFAEIAKMALLAAGLEPMRGVTPQNRTARGEWSAQYVAAMEAMGISTFGTSVAVNTPAPRGAVIQTLLEAFGIDMVEVTGDLYSDVKVGGKYSAAVETATRAGIVSGDDGRDTFRPNDPVNRAEVAKMIVNAILAYAQ